MSDTAVLVSASGREVYTLAPVAIPEGAITEGAGPEGAVPEGMVPSDQPDPAQDDRRLSLGN